jgi:hypothetical protein
MQQEEWQGCLFLMHKHEAAANHAYGRDRDQQPAPQHKTQTNKGLKLTLALAEPTAVEAMIVMMVENFIVDDNVE